MTVATKTRGGYNNNYNNYLLWLQLNWQQAASHCCKMNMQLVMLEDATKQKCIANLLKSIAKPSLKSRNYINALSANGIDVEIGKPLWTSGSDERTQGTYRWCSSPTFLQVAGISFFPGEPNNYNGQEHCLVALPTSDAYPDNFRVNDFNCATEHRFMCEVCIRYQCRRVNFDL